MVTSDGAGRATRRRPADRSASRRRGIGHDGCVSEDGSDDPTFERWMQEVSHNSDAPPNDPGTVSAGWRRWLYRFFEARGPVAKEAVMRAAMEHQVALANEAVAVVLADLRRTTELRPQVEVDVWMESSIRISIDGGFTAPSMWEVDQPEAFAEVADTSRNTSISIPSSAASGPCARNTMSVFMPRFTTAKPCGGAAWAIMQSPQSARSMPVHSSRSRAICVGVTDPCSCGDECSDDR